MIRDERGGLWVFAVAKGAGLPRIRESDSIGARVSIEDSCHWAVSGDFRVEARIIVGLCSGGARSEGGAGGGAAGCVTTPTGGIGCRGVAEGAGGAELTLCDRSRRVAWIGESTFSIAGKVERIGNVDWTVASCVLIVSSCLVMNARALSEEQRQGMRIDSPSDKSLSCLSLGMGIWSCEKRSLSRVS